MSARDWPEFLWQNTPLPRRKDLTARAVRSCHLAEQAAIADGPATVGAGHLLLGLVLESAEHGGRGVTGKALHSLGCDSASLRNFLATQRPGPAEADGEVASPDARLSLDRSFSETTSRHDGYVGTEHLLRGLFLAWTAEVEAVLHGFHRDRAGAKGAMEPHLLSCRLRYDAATATGKARKAIRMGSAGDGIVESFLKSCERGDFEGSQRDWAAAHVVAGLAYLMFDEDDRARQELDAAIQLGSEEACVWMSVLDIRSGNPVPTPAGVHAITPAHWQALLRSLETQATGACEDFRQLVTEASRVHHPSVLETRGSAVSENAAAIPASTQRLVFISHASEDSAYAQSLTAALEAGGAVPWIAPRDIPAGANYAEEIVKAVARSSHMVVILSPYSLASEHVKNEMEIAVRKGAKLLPLRDPAVELEDLPDHFTYHLSRVQIIDKSAPFQDAHALLAQLAMGDRN